MWVLSGATATGSTGPTQTVTVGANQLVVQALSGFRTGTTVTLTPSGGGTNRYLQSGTAAGLMVGDTNVSTTFSSSGTTAAWAGIATVLNAA
jgi:hypothetical protein